MDNLTGVTAFIDEPPVIEINGGIVVVTYRKAGTQRAMSVRTLRRTVERGERALARHATGEDHITVDE